METMFFASFDPSTEVNKGFLRDLALLLKLRPEIFASLKEEYLNQAKLVRSMRRKEKDEVAANLEMSLTELSASLDVLEFVVSRLSQKACEDDTPDGLAGDLIQLVPSAGFDKKDLIKLFSDLKERIVPAYEKVKKKGIVSVSVLPHLQGVATSVELCPVTERSFELGDSADDYDPEISAYAPVVSVFLRSSSRSKKEEEFMFQASTQAIGLLIEQLRSAIVQVEAFEKFVKKDLT